ncbi:hypothetical protein LIER_21659 [Lithospermum erythrorhizon]|uniref:Reverse transcriptase RNase H-like domain-containing protein n=1 Tax=Lithospermum erythrorhizon TaxID=34254 RepID=A0AAV3QS84_LITER
MRGAETRYPQTEKLVYALILATRKLKPYFEAHPVGVVTNQTLQKILENLSRSGRIVKWVIDLSKFDMWYKPRMSINAQALTNFMVEYTYGPGEAASKLINLIEDSQESVWLLFVDGASNQGVSGVGILL